MGPGVDPHLYQATQADLSKLRKADVILYVGMHLEGKIQDTLEKMNGQGRKHSVSVTKDIDKTTLLKDPEAEEYPDPHIWFEVPLWAQTVDAVVETLSKADPANKALTRFYLDTEWNGEEWFLQSRAMDETGYVQPTKAQLRDVRGLNSIYHNNCIQTWWVKSNGEAENVEVS